MSRPIFGNQTKDAFVKPKREEIGCIWKKTTKTNEDMLNIRLSKSKLKELLATVDEEVELKLIAFSNKTTNDKQPNFRIFQEGK